MNSKNEKWLSLSEESCSEEDLPSFLANAFPEQSYISLEHIITHLIASEDWRGWWEYHCTNWDASGWKQSHYIFKDDFPLLFDNAALTVSANNYQFITTAHRFNVKKIDEQGQFQWFPGLSIISFLPKLACWIALHKSFEQCPLLSEYYKILPLDSWHLTMVDLFTPNVIPESKDAWLEVLHTKKSSLEHTKKLLDNNTCEPSISLSRTRALGILLIEVEVDNTSRKTMDRVAELIASEGALHPHISLAYQYKPLSLTASRAIEDKWGDAIPQLLKDVKLVLERPQLVHFESMETFTDALDYIEDNERYSLKLG